MINCSHLTTTSEETHSWHPDNDSTVDQHLMHALPKEHSLAQVSLPLGLGHQAACSSQGTQSAKQLVPSKEHSLAQWPLPLRLGHQSTCSSQGKQPCLRAFPTGTRPPSSLFFQKNTASLKGLSHWDSTTNQLVLSKEHSITEVPTTKQLVPPNEHSLVQRPLSLGLGRQAACSSKGTQPRSSASPTGIRPPSSLFLTWNTTSLKDLSHTPCKSRPATHINVCPGPCGTYFTFIIQKQNS
ncbi:hypothetical protein Adt_25087 [Abeliophyllum distichum]|uniref:Uncharacterized protein n=1 Tax=Abeliophyllum distichum TaxID=126358 RepID=A0ABD1SIM1_9LAMI